MQKITDVVPSETSDNDISIAMEGLIISSDLEGNDKTRNKNKEKPQPDELASFKPIIVSAIDNIRNIKYVNALILTQYIGTYQKLWPPM